MKKSTINFSGTAKELIKLICLIMIGVAGVSCEKALEESPKDVVEELFYNTDEEVGTAVNAIYSPLRDNSNGYAVANYIASLECQSDWILGRGSWSPLSEYQGLNDVNITRVSTFWNAFFQSIRNANLVIRNAPLGSDISQQNIDKHVAEARFLRAWNYFQLVRNWGSIPLRTETNMDEKDLKKSSPAEIYELIVGDLLDAEAKLPDNPSAKGRPGKWAAKTLLADVYLQLERYADAAAKAGEVLQSGKYSLVKISSKADIQNNIFGPTLQNSTEEVFYLKYARVAGQGNYILWISNHPSTGNFSFGGAYAVHSDATNPNYVNWDQNDFRKLLWDKINFGSGPNTLVTSKYIDKAAISQNDGSGNDQPIYRYSEVLLLYAEAACRAEGSVSSAAMEALNKVHRRAYGYDPSIASPVDYDAADFNMESFIDLVIKERGYELQFEGKRWLELKRTGKADELILASKGKTIAEKHRLWPIPLSELNYNKALDPAGDQNPGY